MLINTVYDYITQLLHRKPKELLLLFSVFHNLEHVFNFEQKNEVKEINCIYGLKAISMMWIIFGHTYMWNVLAPLDNAIILTNVSLIFIYLLKIISYTKKKMKL